MIMTDSNSPAASRIHVGKNSKEKGDNEPHVIVQYNQDTESAGADDTLTFDCYVHGNTVFAVEDRPNDKLENRRKSRHQLNQYPRHLKRRAANSNVMSFAPRMSISPSSRKKRKKDSKDIVVLSDDESSNRVVEISSSEDEVLETGSSESPGISLDVIHGVHLTPSPDPARLHHPKERISKRTDVDTEVLPDNLVQVLEDDLQPDIAQAQVDSTQPSISNLKPTDIDLAHTVVTDLSYSESSNDSDDANDSGEDGETVDALTEMIDIFDSEKAMEIQDERTETTDMGNYSFASKPDNILKKNANKDDIPMSVTDGNPKTLLSDVLHKQERLSSSVDQAIAIVGKMLNTEPNVSKQTMTEQSVSNWPENTNRSSSNSSNTISSKSETNNRNLSNSDFKSQSILNTSFSDKIILETDSDELAIRNTDLGDQVTDSENQNISVSKDTIDLDSHLDSNEQIVSLLNHNEDRSNENIQNTDMDKKTVIESTLMEVSANSDNQSTVDSDSKTEIIPDTYPDSDAKVIDKVIPDSPLTELNACSRNSDCQEIEASFETANSHTIYKNTNTPPVPVNADGNANLNNLNRNSESEELAGTNSENPPIQKRDLLLQDQKSHPESSSKMQTSIINKSEPFNSFTTILKQNLKKKKARNISSHYFMNIGSVLNDIVSNENRIGEKGQSDALELNRKLDSHSDLKHYPNVVKECISNKSSENLPLTELQETPIVTSNVQDSPVNEASVVCNSEHGVSDTSNGLNDQRPFLEDSLERVDPPELIGVAYKEFQKSYDNCLRGCKWSPDGSCVLTNSNDNILRLFELPEDYNKRDSSAEFAPFTRMIAGETVYDMDWYPYMDKYNTDTCCFLTTSRDHPVHLWDIPTASVRCSYRAFDQMDELVSASSVAFSLDGSKIYCGFNKAIRIFDSSRPGRDSYFRDITGKSKGSRKGKKRKNSRGQSGIISSIAFTNEYTGMYALGSFDKTIGLYAKNSDQRVSLLEKHIGGVTQVKFIDGYLLSGGRMDPELRCWDLRNTVIPVFKMLRTVTTNQRIQFDIDSAGNVVSGGTDKLINFWQLNGIFNKVDAGCETDSFQPTYHYRAHFDAVNSISVHPRLPLFASTSGQRHFMVKGGSESDSGECENRWIENSLKIWKL